MPFPSQFPEKLRRATTRLSGDIRRATAALFVPDIEPSRKSFPVSGPAKCAKSIVLDANMDLMAIIG